MDKAASVTLTFLRRNQYVYFGKRTLAFLLTGRCADLYIFTMLYAVKY